MLCPHTLTSARGIISRLARRWSLGQPSRGKKRTRRLAEDPHHADHLPVFEFVGERVKADHLLYTWGVADHGGLGRASLLRPDRTKRQCPLHYLHHPHRLDFGEFYDVVDVACGYGFTVLAVKKKAEFTCYGTGLNSDSQLGYHDPRKDHPLGMLISPAPLQVPIHFSDRIVKVACGRAHTVMLTDKGEVWTVGNNAYGQCGRPIIQGEQYGRQCAYKRLESLKGVTITQIECGQDTSFFLSESGEVYSCGWGADGQTGQGHYNNEPVVGLVQGDVTGEKIVQVSCKADCALAVSETGDVFGWGNSEYHQLNSVTEEMQIHTSRHLSFPSMKKVVQVAAAGSMCVLLDEDGDVFSWGFGPLGKGPKVTHSKTPTQIPPTLFGRNEITPEAKVVSLACGINHFAVINSQGSLFTWGKNPGGCLGQGHLNDHFFPLRVSIAGEVRKVSCGVDHTVALVKELL